MIFYPELACQLKETYPNMKFIVLVRSSIDRAYSHFMMRTRKKAESRSWELAVEARLTLFPSAPLTIPQRQFDRFDYLNGSCILPYIQAWLDVTPADQFLFIESQRLFTEPEDSIKKVFEFLGVPNVSGLEFPHINKGDYQSSMSAEMVEKLQKWFAPHDIALNKYLIANAPNLIGDFR